MAAELERELAAMDDVPEEEEEDDDAFYERLANLSAWRGTYFSFVVFSIAVYCCKK